MIFGDDSGDPLRMDRVIAVCVCVRACVRAHNLNLVNVICVSTVWIVEKLKYLLWDCKYIPFSVAER